MNKKDWEAEIKKLEDFKRTSMENEEAARQQTEQLNVTIAAFKAQIKK